MKLIDADALCERMYHDAFETDSDMQKWDSGCWIRYRMFETAVEEQPIIEERKKGKWEMLQIPINPPIYKCSICGKHALETMTGCLVNRHYEACLTDFCPHCGADMR